MAGRPAVRSRAPLLLLLVALSTAFWFGNERRHFYRHNPHHNWISSQSLTLAENLSPEHRFLLFFGQFRRGPGQPPEYAPYHSFPITVFALVKLVMLPFGENVPAKIYAARLLMLTFFAGAAVLAFLSLRRLLASDAAALFASLLAFSSARALYYNDMVSMEIPSLCGVLLAFHGMVVFAQEGRFRRLLLKTAIGVALGWQTVTLALTFAALGGGRLLRRRCRGGAPPEKPNASRGNITLSHYAAPAGAAVLVFTLLLGGGLLNEYRYFNGERSFIQLPTVRSILERTSLDPRLIEGLPGATSWGAFLPRQLSRLGDLMLPNILFGVPPGDQEYFKLREWNHACRLAPVGAAALAVALLGAARMRRRLPALTLALFGLTWSLPMRAHSAFHDYDALFYVGVPLLCYGLAFGGIVTFMERLRIAPAAARTALIAVVMIVFGSSAWAMAKVANYRPGDVQFQRDTAADFQTIRQVTAPGDSILIVRQPRTPLTGLTGAVHGLNFYLSGRIIVRRTGKRRSRPHVGDYDFVLADQRLDDPSLLTPGNRRVFLYDGAALSLERLRNTQSSGRPREKNARTTVME